MIHITPRPAGFIIDVPVTLSVAIRGEGLTEAEAKRITRIFAESLNPTEQHIEEFPGLRAGITITAATLEANSEDSAEVLDYLEAE